MKNQHEWSLRQPVPQLPDRPHPPLGRLVHPWVRSHGRSEAGRIHDTIARDGWLGSSSRSRRRELHARRVYMIASQRAIPVRGIGQPRSPVKLERRAVGRPAASTLVYARYELHGGAESARLGISDSAGGVRHVNDP